MSTKKYVINLYGGPATGKSTVAAELFVKFKHSRVHVEYVNEYAKELVYEENHTALQEQVIVFANQLYRLQNALKHNDLVICDSPLLLSCVYNQPDTDLMHMVHHPSYYLRGLAIYSYKKFNNIDIVLEHAPELYTPAGRIHSYAESLSLHHRIIAVLQEHEIPYITYHPVTGHIDQLMSAIQEKLAWHAS